MTPDLFPHAPATRRPANDDVGNAPAVGLAGPECARRGWDASIDVVPYDSASGLVALHVPERARAADAWPWHGRLRK